MVDGPVIDLSSSFILVVNQNNHFNKETTRSQSTIASFTALLRQARVDGKSAWKELSKCAKLGVRKEDVNTCGARHEIS
ncbi:hypothetical protein FocTR4_00011012 [Fusarium oxysporum f. sp. cubense]|nr:hypothetical protein FocTR4_00011012 [Fusarium oxysporum f. sp. cubense]